LNPKHSLSGARAPRSTVIARHRVGASRRPMTGSSGRSNIPPAFVVESKGRGVLESGFPPHGATPADQLSSALQTQNLDLNRSRFQSKHSPEVQSMG
jgi:hypothetical protein